MAFKDLLAASAALALLAGSVAPVAAQQSTAPAPEVMQTPAPAPAPQDQTEPDEAAVGEMEPTGAVAEEAEPALTPAEIAEETRQCKDQRRKALKRCLAQDYQCRAAAMRRNQSCLARLQAR